jgi:TetR/AcrR family transcriptional regulator
MTERDKVTEERIFEAAKTVFSERGMDGARMQEIADKAGINKSLLHYYFRSKEKLFNAVFDDIAGMTFMKFAQIFAYPLPLEEKIRYFFSEHIEFMKLNPGLPIFILTEINRNPARMQNLIKKIDYSSILEIFTRDMERENSGSSKPLTIKPGDLAQIVTTAVAMSVFPFAAKNLLEPALQHAGIPFDHYIEERKEFAANFIINYLKSPKS